jgi:spermidine synthase
MDFFKPERIAQLKAMSHGGKPFVFDDGDIRTLQFDERIVQSAMRLSAPDELLIPYTQAMTGFLLFNPAPAHILLIGLGGGSLLKYCYRHLPATRLTVLEIDADVIALREQFMIPADDERLQVVHADARSYLRQMPEASADVILLDGFDAEGAVAELNSHAFFDDCRRVLRDGGVLLMNMADDMNTATLALTAGQSLFTLGRLWWLKTVDGNSHLAVMLKVADTVPDADLRDTMMRMCRQFSLELIYPRHLV